MSTKVTVEELIGMKSEGRKITVITAYDYPTAYICDKIGMDIILVGDSVGMTVLGYKNTIPVTMEEMILFTKAVARGTEKAFLVADMPFMSYNINPSVAIENACRLIKEGGADAVKIEGGLRMKSTIKHMVEAGIPVMGHIGMTPQTAPLWSGYKVQGKTSASAIKIIEDARSLVDAGAFSIVLELVTTEVARLVTEDIQIPTIGIGSGASCNGQVLVLHDILGMSNKLSPKFVKSYVNISEIVHSALTKYRQDVVRGTFPDDKHTFHMEEDEYMKLIKLKNKKI